MTNPTDASANGANEGVRPAMEAMWERPVLPGSGGEVALLVRIVAPALAAAGRRAPVDAAFVLDRSGSMSGGKLELAKIGVDHGVAHLRDGDRVGAVVYDNEVETVMALGAATSRAKATLRLALHGVDARGSTFLSGGWTTGCTLLAEAPAGEGGTRVRRVILLTDGLANVGIVDPRELARHAGELRRRGIATTTIGVGQDFDEGLLSAMAEAGGGHFQYAADAEALRTFFAQELRQMTEVAVSHLTVTLTLPYGATAELLSVFPVEPRGSSLEIAVGDLHAGDEIALLFVLRAAPAGLGKNLEASLRAAWTDMVTDRTEEAEIAIAPLRYVATEEVATVPVNDMVVEEKALQRAAIERRAGLELDRQGNIAEAHQRLAQARDVLRTAPLTTRISEDLMRHDSMVMPMMAAPAGSAQRSHLRKYLQVREDFRRRGRRDEGDEGGTAKP
ncbi:MAG: VWA domain-containing protein [Thermomicrobiales bacterium]